MNYYDTNVSRVRSEVELRLIGVPVDNNDALVTLGLYLIEHNEPLFDHGLYRLEPSGDPVPKDGSCYTQQFVAVPLDINQAKMNIKDRITEKKSIVEIGGINVPNFGRVLTEKKDQDRVALALQGCTSANISEIDFKGADGNWQRISMPTLTEIFIAMSAHIQACFSRERALHEAVDACTDVATLAAIDIDSGWPSNN